MITNTDFSQTKVCATKKLSVLAKIIYDILDDNFFQKTGYQYRLSMLLTDTTCSYLLYDDAQWLAYRSYALDSNNRALFSLKDELETLMHQDKMLNLSFQSIDIQLLTNSFTFVPTPLFEESQVMTYLANVTPSPSSEIIKKENVAENSFVNVYVTKLDLHRFLQKTFTNYQLSHLLTKQINTYQAHAEFVTGKKLYLNFHQNNLQITYFEEQNFVFANNFPFQTSNDAAYYTMLVINQLHLNPETINVYVSGHIDKDAELYNTVFRYIRNIIFMQSTIEHEDNSPFGKYPAHTFIDMM